LFVNPGPGSPEIQAKPLDVIKLKADAALTLDGVQKKIIAIKGGQPDKMRAIREAANALDEAEGADARDAAKDKLAGLLDEYFEADMERREQELAQVEERVKKLRSTLERRREKKRDIIDLQMEVLLNEVDGLGFFGGEAFGLPGVYNDFTIRAFPGGQPPMALPPAPPNAPAPAVAPPQPARSSGYGGGGRGGYEGRGSGLRGRDPREIEASTREREEERERNYEREREPERGEERDRGDAPR
jgi:hypothetical protein